MKILVTVDSCKEEPEDIPHVKLNDDNYAEVSDK
jgi:hypothetical protein